MEQEEKFKPHMMYAEDGQKEMADTYDEHLELEKQDMGHTAPTAFKMKGFPDHATAAPLKRCWKGYEPNPDGRPAKEQGSCVPVKMASPNKSIKDKLKVGLKVAKPFLKGAAKRATGVAGLVLGSVKTASADQPGTGGHGGRKTGSIHDMM